MNFKQLWGLTVRIQKSSIFPKAALMAVALCFTAPIAYAQFNEVIEITSLNIGDVAISAAESCEDDLDSCGPILAKTFEILEENLIRLESSQVNMAASIALSTQLSATLEEANKRYNGLVDKYRKQRIEVRELKEELDDAAVAAETAADDVAETAALADALQGQLDAATEQRDQLQDELETVRGGKEKLLEEIAAIEDQLKALTEARDSLVDELSDAARALADAQRALKATQDAEAALRDQNAAADVLRQELEGQLKVADDQAQALQGQIAGANDAAAELERKIDELEQASNANRMANAALADQLAKADEDRKALGLKLSGSEAANQDLLADMAALAADRDGLAEDLGAKVQELADAQNDFANQLSIAENAQDALDLELLNSQAENQGLRNDITALNLAQDQLVEQVDALEQQRRDLEQKLADSGDLSQDQRDEILALIADRDGLENRLGAKTQELADAKMELANAQAEFANKMAIAADERDALDIELRNSQAENQRLLNEIAALTLLRDELLAEVDALLKRRDELGNQVDELEKQIDGLENQLAASEQTSRRKSEEIAALIGEREALDLELRNSEAKNQGLLSDVAALNLAQDELTAQVDTLEGLRSELERKLAEAGDLGLSQGNEIASLIADRDELSDRLSAKIQELADTQVALEQALAENADLIDEREAMKAAMAELNDQLSALQQDNAALSDEYRTAQRALIDAERQAEALGARLDGAERRGASLGDEIAEKNAQLIALDGELVQLEYALDDEVQKQAAQARRIKQLDNLIEQQNDRIAQLNERLLEELSRGEDLKLANEGLLISQSIGSDEIDARDAEIDRLTQQLADQEERAKAANDLVLSLIGDLSNVTPYDLRDVQDFGENPQNYIYNNIVAGWMRNKDFGNLQPLAGNTEVFSTVGIRDLQREMNEWMQYNDETMLTLNLPFQRVACGDYLCEDGIVGRRTKQLAVIIHTREPGFFPGAAVQDLLK